MSDPLKVPVEVRLSLRGAGKGRGREKRRDDCRRRAVGDVAAFDMANAVANGCVGAN